ncbi:glutathione S-transferase, partial [Vibrio vulnificus]
MHAAWHFWYAVSFGGESGLREVGLGGIHPLTQRYVLRIKMKHSVFM